MLRWNVIYSVINSMLEESKCCSDVMKKNFSQKEHMMTKKDDEDFKELYDMLDLW